MATETKDTVDSLGDIFSNASPETSVSEEKPATESTESTGDKSSSSESGAESDKDKPPADKSDESKEETDTPPSKTEEEIAAEKAAADKKEEKPKEGDKKDEKKADAPEGEATLQKRFEDTRKWANDVHQQNQQLRQIAEQQQQQLAILQKKVDGTWSDADEEALNKGHTTEDVAVRAVQVGKAIADKASVTRELGDDAVNEGLTRYKQLFGGNQIIQASVAESESPVREALAFVERYDFQSKYGSSPKDIKANIEKELRTSIEKELRKSILEEIRAGKSKHASTPEQLAGSKGDHGDNGKLKEVSATPLKDIFS